MRMVNESPYGKVGDPVEECVPARLAQMALAGPANSKSEGFIITLIAGGHVFHFAIDIEDMNILKLGIDKILVAYPDLRIEE